MSDYIANLAVASDVRAALNALVDISTLLAGENLTAGDPVILNTTDGEWYHSQATAEASIAGPAGVVVANAAEGAPVQVRIRGPLAQAGLAKGTYWFSATKGEKTTTPPSAVGEFRRILGYVHETGVLYVDPSKVWVEIPQPGTIVNINTQVGTEYVLVLSDLGSVVEMNNANANSVVIPLDEDVDFPAGSRIDVMQTGAGKTSVIGDVDVTVNGVVEAGAGETKKECIAVWRGISLYKRGANSWGAMGFFG